MAEEVKENEVSAEVSADVNTESAQTAEKPEQKGKNERRGGKFDKNRRPRSDRPPREADEFEKRMVDIRSVQKTVQGGRVQSFSALCVVGDKKGRVGIGTGKAREATNAIEKGFNSAKKNMITVSIDNTTIPHAITMKYGASVIRLIPAKQGTGVIAGGAARPVLELAGIKDITAKRQGSNNKINIVRATFNALKAMRTKDEVAKLRGKTTEDL